MKRIFYTPSGISFRFSPSFLLFAWLVAVTSSCTTKPYTSLNYSQPVTTTATTGAAAQSASDAWQATQPAGAPEADELLASNTTALTDVKQEKLTNRLVDLKNQLEKIQAQKASQTVSINEGQLSKRASLPAKLLMKKLVKKTKHINDTQATHASGNSLVLIGVILAAVGLLVLLLGSNSAVALVLLIVGIVLALAGLL